MNNNPQKSVIYGIQVVRQAILLKKSISTIYLQKKDAHWSFQKLFALIRKHQIPFQFAPKTKLDKLTYHALHQGIVAEISPIEYQSLGSLLANTNITLLLMLDQITDVRNFGSIIRSAECAGVQGIIIPKKNTAKINSLSVKTSAGAMLDMPICRELNLKNAVKHLKIKRFQIIAAVENSKTTYTAIDFTKPSLIIAGSENKGISEQLLKHTHAQVSIPMLGKTPSLNVSVATAVILFEVVRQRIQSKAF